MRESTELFAFLVGCGLLVYFLAAEPSVLPGSPEPASPGDSTFPRTVQDDYGKYVYLPTRPDRIASVTLASDEILLSLVPPDRLVACTYFATDPGISGCAELAKQVGRTITGDVEEIISLQPDLAIVAGFTPSENVDLLRGAGLPVYRIGKYDTFDDIRTNIRVLGQLTGAEQQAEKLIETFDSDLSAISQRTSDRPTRRVLYFTPDNYTAGDVTIIDDLFEIANARNAAAEAGITGHQNISTEIAIALNPDVILMPATFASADGEMQDPTEFLMQSPAWQEVTAVRQGNVHVVPARAITCISHYVVEAAEIVAGLIHPESL